jgi:hypothetical protein
MNDEEKRIVAAELDYLSWDIQQLREDIGKLRALLRGVMSKKTITGGIGTDPPTTIEVTLPRDYWRNIFDEGGGDA